MPIKTEDIKVDLKKVGSLRFKKLNKDYLLTNDVGSYQFLSLSQFKDFLRGKVDKKDGVYAELERKGFIKKTSYFKSRELINDFRLKNCNLFNRGPSLHIIVATLRCNLKCLYCQAASRPLSSKAYDMDLNTAKQTVDFIFETPNRFLTIEFQGGEPLANWPIVKFIIEYARNKNRNEGRNLKITMVSNLVLMNEKRLEFLLKNKVNICTSLDGPEKIHNRNRPLAKGNSYWITTSWIRKIQKKTLKQKESPHHLGALMTTSKYSLKHPKAIIDEYLKWGFQEIHLRPLTFLGLARQAKNKIGYSAEEFINFWKKGMDYIISINKQGKTFQERESQIMFQKILTNKDPGYTDLRSPCGAALGQILYNYDGNIYTCDEGRMLKDDTFLIGNIRSNTYSETVFNNKVKTMLTASCLDNLVCDYCVYKPYCGVCPAKNYAYYGNLFPQIKNTDWCKIKTAQFDYIFNKVLDRGTKEIFEKWVEKS